MRKLLAVALVAVAASAGAQIARAADMPEYPDVEVPSVDYGMPGGFYLRASLGANVMHTYQHVDTVGTITNPSGLGYGYSVGAGFGYETGDGLRADLTLDYLQNNGLSDGVEHLNLRSAVALANVYYDFPLGGPGMGMGGSAEGGLGAYVGAGLGGAYYQAAVRDDVTGLPVAGIPDGDGFTPAVAGMAGVTYDAGQWVADVGYRMIYMPTITNGQDAFPFNPYYLNGNTVHELRATVRYRLQ